MSISDRVFVMQAGAIAQAGTPEAIYAQPQSEFVARFIGHYNVLQPMDAARVFRIDPPACRVVAVRPEAFTPAEGGDRLTVSGVVTQASMLGSVIRYGVRCEGVPIQVETVNQNAGVPGVGQCATLAPGPAGSAADPCVTPTARGLGRRVCPPWIAPVTYRLHKSLDFVGFLLKIPGGHRGYVTDSVMPFGYTEPVNTMK